MHERSLSPATVLAARMACLGLMGSAFAQGRYRKLPSQIYEYACQKGNYGMANILGGAWATEAKAAEAGHED